MPSILEECINEMGFDISSPCIKALECFAGELKKWNRKINLTSMTDDDDIAIKHIVDAVVASSRIRGANRVLDIGSGAGVPAIPLKILFPEVHVVSVDSVGKKIHFQRHIGRLLGLKQFDAVHDRGENLCGQYSSYFDLIISRAFSKLETFVAMAHPLLTEGGQLVAMKGPGADEEIHEGENFLQVKRLHVSEIHKYSLPRHKGERCLVMVSSVKTL